MEKIEERMIQKQTRAKDKEEQKAIAEGIPSEILVYEILHRLALCEGALERMAPGFINDYLYKV